MPLQLRRLCLRGDCRLPSLLHPELPHQLSTLMGLEALQARAGQLSMPASSLCTRVAVVDMHARLVSACLCFWESLHVKPCCP